MHTVPESYFQAFAGEHPARRGTPGVWRFDRVSKEFKILGVRDAEVSKDIYVVLNDDGSPDTGIEDELLCTLKGAFCTARAALKERGALLSCKRSLEMSCSRPLEMSGFSF
jgi:hypothetical protein